jgi:protein TonB
LYTDFVRVDGESTMRPRYQRAGGGDPLDRVFQLGASDRRPALSSVLVAALLAHGGLAGALELRVEALPTQAGWAEQEQELAIDREVPPPPPPPPAIEPSPPLPPEPAKIVANATVPPPNPSDNPYDEPASEAARAGEVLVQDSDAEDDTDEDENTFVAGDGGTYAGGVTASGGTSAVAVRGSVVRDGGVPGGSGAPSAPTPAVRDLSRGAWLEGNTAWDDCEFPGEAERDKIRDAVVAMTVTVRPNGTAQSVDILEDPGHGFARMATACALRHRFAPALDSAGRRIWGKTRLFHVGFHR